MYRRRAIACLGMLTGLSGCVTINRYGVPGAEDEDVGGTETPTAASVPEKRQQLTTGKGPLADTKAIEIAVHERVDEVRAANGLHTLPMDEDYRDSAQTHSRDMAHKGYFAHEGPNGQQFKPNGCNRWMENIYRYRGSVSGPGELAEKAVTAWLNSEGHRKNMLDGDIFSKGVGAAKGEDGYVYITLTLCG